LEGTMRKLGAPEVTQRGKSGETCGVRENATLLSYERSDLANVTFEKETGQRAAAGSGGRWKPKKKHKTAGTLGEGWLEDRALSFLPSWGGGV